MGASNSKEERVYVYGNEVPIGFAPQLKDQIVKEATASSNKQQQQQQQQKDGKDNTKSLPDQVEREVAKELTRILEKQQLEDLKAKERQASTVQLLNEIRDISQQISASPSTKSPTFTKSLEARDRVTACLRESAGRTLDCWKEVSEFKQLVSNLEAEFVSATK